MDLVKGRFATLRGKALAVPARKPLRALACQTKVLGGPFKVRVPRRSLMEAGEKIVMDFGHTPPLAVRPPVRKEHLKLPVPTLLDQQGDIERIIDGLRGRGIEGSVACSVYVARSGGLAARSGYDLTATVAADDGAWHIIRLEKGDTTGALYGAAVDVGTTTVVVALVDLVKGKIVDAASSFNRQIVHGDNVASRISFAATPERLEELRDLVIGQTVNALLGMLTRRHDLSPEDIVHMTVSGNTVMMHLFCGASPAGLGGVPFAPVSNFLGPYRAGQLHLAMNPEALVDIMPSAAAYVGGDITSDAYVSGLHARKELSVLIDIGTNAEIVVGNQDRSIACAAPAGPAFEGHGLTCGMRASAGAIDTIRIESLDKPAAYTVIGSGRPNGVCGSGLIDFVAQAYRAGVISMAGRFTPEAVRGCPCVKPVRQSGSDMLAYEIVPARLTEEAGSPIIVTERDIAALLQAKGVIYAALKIAMKHFGHGFGEVDRFYLAGGFARYIDLDNAVGMGMLPNIDRSRFTFMGNGSLAGAFVDLVDGEVRKQLPHVAAAPRVIELNLDPEFMDAYTLAMMLPER